jgi:hypothetical protein
MPTRLNCWPGKDRPQRTFLVHGEQYSMSKFAARLGDAHVELPVAKQVFEM